MTEEPERKTCSAICLGEPSVSNDLLSIARHEAGHAIIAHQQGFAVESIELNVDGGAVFHDGPGERLERGDHPLEVAISLGLVAVAGAAASNVPMSARDNESLERALWLGDFDRGYFFVDRDTLTERARDRLAEHQVTIERIARALVERGRLSGDEFRELLEP